jgi:hypothetical protein
VKGSDGADMLSDAEGMDALQHHLITVVQAAGDQDRALGILRDADRPQLEDARPGMQNPHRMVAVIPSRTSGLGAISVDFTR